MAGKRSGKRSAERRRGPVRPALLGLAGGVTLAVVAWGYLVYEAVDFGRRARDGDAGAWLFLVVAAIGAVACLFVGLLLVVRILRALDAPRTAGAGTDTVPAPPRPPGGRRAAR